MACGSVMDVLDMVVQVDLSCVALRVLSVAFRDPMCGQMSLIGVRSATEVAFQACFGASDWTIGHASVYNLMLSHVSLVSITFLDCFGMLAFVTPVEMTTGLR